MPKKANRARAGSASVDAKSPQKTSSIVGIVVTAMVAATIGAVITYAALPHSIAKITSQPNGATTAPPNISASPTTKPLTASSEQAPPPPQLVLDLPSREVAVNLGNWYSDHKNWPAAVTYYEEAVHRGFDNSDVRTDLGNAYRFSGHPAQALSEYVIAHNASPLHQQSLFNQGSLYAIDLNEPHKAIGIWQSYLKAFPKGQFAEQARHLIEVVQAHSGDIAGTESKPASQ
jgi:hypothetical protein